MELKVEGRPEVRSGASLSKLMSPDQCGKNRHAVDFPLFPFDARATGMDDLPRPVHEVGNCGQLGDGRLGRLQQLSTCASMCPPCFLLLVSCFVWYFISCREASGEQMPSMPRLLAHITKTKRAPLYRSCDRGCSSRDLAWTRWEKEKSARHVQSQAHARQGEIASSAELAQRVLFVKPARPHHEGSCIHHTTSRVLSGGLGRTGYTRRRKACGAFEGSWFCLFPSLLSCRCPSTMHGQVPEGMASGRVSRVSRAGQVPWYSGYVINPPRVYRPVDQGRATHGPDGSWWLVSGDWP
jgi:hypothetical protein